MNKYVVYVWKTDRMARDQEFTGTLAHAEAVERASTLRKNNPRWRQIQVRDETGEESRLEMSL